MESWRNVKRLTNWKSQYLSLGGRLTLINAVVDALASYMMSVFPLPANVSNSIDALGRNFLWQGNEDKKFHLVKWEELIVSKNTGGLGIRNFREQNQSLMMKWFWKFANEDNMLWE